MTATTRATGAVTSRTKESERVLRGYLGDLARGELGDAQRRWFSDDSRSEIVGVTPLMTKQEVVQYYEDLKASMPDYFIEIVELVADGDLVASRWRLTCTFAGPARFMGLAPNGRRLELRGVDYARIRDGQIIRMTAFMDYTTAARQLGALPQEGSLADRASKVALNVRTAAERALRGSARPEPFASGVWRVRARRGRGAFLVRDGSGVALLAVGTRLTRPALATAAAQLGGLTRVLSDDADAAAMFFAPVEALVDGLVVGEFRVVRTAGRVDLRRDSDGLALTV